MRGGETFEQVNNDVVGNNTAVLGIEGLDDVTIVCLATDGIDGPTDAAGALADGTTVSRARALGLDPAAHLANNDAYTLFEALGDLLITGPTDTNVNDLALLLAW
jgi:glycerate 2-kinase